MRAQVGDVMRFTGRKARPKAAAEGAGDQEQEDDAMAGVTWTTRGVFTGHGGARTDGAGIMTGNLTVRTTWDGEQADVAVRYTDTEQWFTLAGSPVLCHSGRDSRQLHQAVVEAVRSGGGAAVPQPVRMGGWL